MVPAGNKAKRLSSVNHTIKTIHHHRHHHHHHQPFQDGDRYHIKASPLIFWANQWTGFYMITASVLKGLNKVESASKHKKDGCFFLSTNLGQNMN